MFIPSLAGGLDAGLDVTVVNPLQAALVVGAAATPGHAPNHRYATKMSGSAEDCRLEGIQFLPVVVETLGGWDESAVKQVKKLAAARARHSGQEEALWHAITRLSILLMKGNAAILSKRVHNFCPANVDGIQQ